MFGPLVTRSPKIFTPFSLKRLNSSSIRGVMKHAIAWGLLLSNDHEKRNRPPSSSDL